MSEFPPKPNNNTESAVADSSRGPVSAFELKALEYARRIQEDGESIEAVLEGQNLDGVMYRKVNEILKEQREQEIRSFDSGNLLKHIPIQYLDMADTCADTEEGVEVFIEVMDSRRTLHINEKEMVEAADAFKQMITDFRLYAQLKQKRVSTSMQTKTVRQELDISNLGTKGQEISRADSMSSRDLDIKEMYKIDGPVEGIHCNAQHGQDAFAIEETDQVVCVTVCDGVSSRKSSGEVSARLAEQIAQKSLTEGVQAVVSPDRLEKTLSDISAAIATEGKPFEGGGSTLSTIRIDKKENKIEWAAVGDSPIFVVDTDEQGNMTWKIVTEEKDINESNYTNDEIVEDLKDPETYALSVRGDGNVRVPKEEHIKYGSIQYKPGRRIIVASDCITKMLLHDPNLCFSRGEMWKQILVDDNGKEVSQRSRDMREKAWKDKAQINAQKYPEFWTKDGATGQVRLNPAFLCNMDSGKAKEMLSDWMIDNPVSSDDVTIFSIDLDTYFKRD